MSVTRRPARRPTEKRPDAGGRPALGVECLESRLVCAAVAVPAAQAGSLTQYLLAREPEPGPALAAFACAPTSATNALVSLQRQYPALFGSSLAGRTLADWADTSLVLAGPGFMNTQPALGGTVPEGNLPAGLRAYLDGRGYGGAIDVEGMFPQGEPGGFVETKVGPLPEGYVSGVPTPGFIADALADGAPVIVTILYPPEAGKQVSGHNVLVTGMSWDDATDTGTFTFVDPLDAAVAERRGREGLLPVGAQKLTSGTVSITPTLPLPVVDGIQDVVRNVLTLEYDQYQGELPYRPTDYGTAIAFIGGATVLRPAAAVLAARAVVQLDVGVRRGAAVVMTHEQIARASVGGASAESFVVTATSSGRLQRFDGDRWVGIPRGALPPAHREIAPLVARREIRPGDTVRWIPAAPSRVRAVPAFRIRAWNGVALSATSTLFSVAPTRSTTPAAPATDTTG